jgi:hypothetical protein
LLCSSLGIYEAIKRPGVFGNITHRFVMGVARLIIDTPVKLGYTL